MADVPRPLRALEQWSAPFNIVLSVLLVLVLGSVDFLTGREFSFSVFYLIPVTIAAWGTGRAGGLAIASLSAGVWLGVDLLGGGVYAAAWLPIWNMLVRLGFFVAMAVTLAALHRALDHATELAQVDPLTGIANSRAFQVQLAYQVTLAARYGNPVTLAYVDLDNFKAVNDEFGHWAGDSVLATVAAALRSSLREADLVGRVGGDEFAVLLPQTGAAQAGVALQKLRARTLEDLRARGWPVTLSIGAVTSTGEGHTTEMLIAAADERMYRVKKNGRDAVLIEELAAPGPRKAARRRTAPHQKTGDR